MFYAILFFVSIAINLACAFAWASIGLYAIGILFVIAAALSLIGVLCATHNYQ
jgi:hypothetical protein